MTDANELVSPYVSSNFVMNLASSAPVLTVAPDGTATIHWDRVERCASESKRGIVWAVCRSLLVARATQAARIAELEDNLALRDNFIVHSDLWQEFTQGLPNTRAAVEAAAIKLLKELANDHD